MLNGRALRRGTLNRYNHPIAGRHPTRRDQISPYQVWGLGLCRVKSLMIATTQLSHRQSGLCRNGRLTGPFPPGQPVPTLAAYSGFMTQRRGFFRRHCPAHRALGSRPAWGRGKPQGKGGKARPVLSSMLQRCQPQPLLDASLSSTKLFSAQNAGLVRQVERQPLWRRTDHGDRDAFVAHVLM